MVAALITAATYRGFVKSTLEQKSINHRAVIWETSRLAHNSEARFVARRERASRWSIGGLPHRSICDWVRGGWRNNFQETRTALMSHVSGTAPVINIRDNYQTGFRQAMLLRIWSHPSIAFGRCPRSNFQVCRHEQWLCSQAKPMLCVHRYIFCLSSDVFRIRHGVVGQQVLFPASTLPLKLRRLQPPFWSIVMHESLLPTSRCLHLCLF